MLGSLQAIRHSSHRYAQFLMDNPMPVLGGVADHERLHLARLDSEARVNAVFAQARHSTPPLDTATRHRPAQAARTASSHASGPRLAF